MPDSSTAKSPAFQFYPKDFLSDANVMVMTMAERGIYITLLCVCWEEGSLPADGSLLCRLVRLKRSQLDRAWGRIGSTFVQRGDRLIHPRLEREREKQAIFREKQVENGKRGGRPKKPRPFSGLTQTKAKKSSSSSSASSIFDLRPKPLRSPLPAATAGAVESPTDNGLVAAFLRTFCELFQQHRHGARYQVQPKRDVPLVKRLLQTYAPARLGLMARALLVAEDDWIADTDRGIGILSTKASWLDSRLAEYEATHGALAR